jgi:hypothetical protein
VLGKARGKGGCKMMIRAIVIGIVGAVLTALLAWSPLIPDPLAFHSVALTMIGAIYMGFAFLDGRPSIIFLELFVASGFITLALLGLWVAPVFISVGLILHGIWDLTHRPKGVTTKIPSWYPPFCAGFDFVFAGVFIYLAREIVRTS